MLKVVLGLFLFILTQDCHAKAVHKKIGYTVTPLAIKLQKPGDYADVVVSNDDDRTLYIDHKFVMLKTLSDGREKRFPVNDYSLIASPNKLIVKPHSKEVVRISVVKPLSKDTSYAFLISPVERKMTNKGHKDGMKMVLQCIIEYMVRIRTD